MFIPTGERRDVRVLYLLAFLTTASQGTLELTFPLYLHRFGTPLQLVGAAVAGMAAGQLLSRLPGGAVYSLSRARRSLLIAMLLFSGTTACMGLNPAWALNAGLALGHGFAFGLATTFTLAVLIDVRPSRAGVATTMAWYTAAISAGYAVGAPLGAQAIGALGYRGSFLVSAAVGLGAAALSQALQARPGAAAVQAAAGQRTRLPALAAVLALPAGVWLATLLVFYTNFLSDMLWTYFPIYAVGIGIPLSFVGLLKSVNSLSATGVRFGAAGLFRFLRIGPVNHVCVAAMAVGILGISAITSRPWLVVLCATVGVGRGFVRVTTAASVAEQRSNPAMSTGMASAVYSAGLDIGSMLGPPVGGLLAARIGLPGAFRLAGVALPVVYYLVWAVLRLGSRHSPGPASAQSAPAASAE